MSLTDRDHTEAAGAPHISLSVTMTRTVGFDGSEARAQFLQDFNTGISWFIILGWACTPEEL